MTDRKIVRITISLDVEVFRALADTAKRQMRSNSGMVNWLIATALLGGADTKPPANIETHGDDEP